MPAEQFVARLIAAVCDNIGPCCEKGGYAFDAGGCEAWMQEVVDKYHTLDPSLPNTIYDPQAGAECIARMRDLAASCAVVEEALSCDGVLTGTLPSGASCTANEQCAVPPDGDAGCAAGQGCVAVTRGKEGDACSDTCREITGGGLGCFPFASTAIVGCVMDDGLYCDGTCKPIVSFGGACNDDEACGNSGYCSGGTCKPVPGPGSACATSGYHKCADGSWCDASVCQPAKPLGEACKNHGDCTSLWCGGGGVCREKTVAYTEVCSGTT